MNHVLLSLLAAAGPEETTLRFKALPPPWLLIMVILPLVAGVVWWIYRREGATASARSKRVLAVIRFLVIVLVLFLLFQPYAETSVRKLVRSHLVVLIDTSASMRFVDSYFDAAKAEQTARTAGIPGVSPSSVSRLDLAKGALLNPDLALLDRLRENFHLHVYSFDSELALISSGTEAFAEEGEEAATPADQALETRLREIRATGAWTFLGTATAEVIDEFRLRDEPLAGIVLVTDGRQNGGSVGALVAARKAAAAQPAIPIYAIGVGDPDLPRNIHVTNLRAKEVVLRGDEVTFEFSVSNMGFAGELVTARLETLDENLKPVRELDLRNADVVLEDEEGEQTVRVSHRFEEAGSYALRVGIPVQDGEKIENDNYLIHHLRVVDTKIKVLFVDNGPRWEFRFLKDDLIRDLDTMRVHAINLSADSSVVQPYSLAPDWGPLQHFPRTREELFGYDVVIFGDVDWKELADEDEDLGKQILANLKAFVEEGGGFIMIAGPYDSPRSYVNTPIRDILPIVVGEDEESRAVIDPTKAFNLKLTEEGRRHPIMQLEENPADSWYLWEQAPFSGQFWYYPVERAKVPAATVLAVHPNEGGFNGNEYGPHVLIATMSYGRGQTLYIGVDELWRLRWNFGALYHYRFYGEAIRQLATYKLLVGNRRFKIFTDRSQYFVTDPVVISAKVYDRDFQPSTDPVQVVTIRTPDGDEQQIELALQPDDPGYYEHVVTVNQEGSYRIFADPPDPDGEQPEILFKVEYSTEEMRNPLIDADTLASMSRETGGEALPLYRVGELPDLIPPKSIYVSSEVRSEDLWDDAWIPILFTLLLAAEWLIRKRYRLL